MPHNEYRSLPDECLVGLIKTDEAAYSELISRHLGTVRRLARLYCKSLSDYDDIVSEGIIGLINASEKFRPGGMASFSTFAYACIHNRIMTALKKSARITDREENIEEAEAISSIGSVDSPESILIGKEEIGEVFSAMEKGFSQKEKEVFERYISGATYQEIASELDLPLKSVGNALARVRMKLRNKLR